jgi:hypothetical protein
VVGVRQSSIGAEQPQHLLLPQAAVMAGPCAQHDARHRSSSPAQDVLPAAHGLQAKQGLHRNRGSCSGCAGRWKGRHLSSGIILGRSHKPSQS